MTEPVDDPRVTLTLKSFDGLRQPIESVYHSIPLTDGNPEDLEVVGRFFQGCFFNFARDLERHGTPKIERGQGSDEDMLQLARSTEHLIGQVQILLHDARAWKDTPDVELDVGNSLKALRDEVGRPVAGTDAVMVERLTTRLSKYVVAHERSQAEGEAAEALERLEESVLDVMAAMDGTDADVPAALDAVESLAGMMRFADLDKPDDVDLAEWDEFLEEAEANPSAVLHESFEWRARKAIDATKEKYLPLGLGEVGGLASIVGAAVPGGIPASGMAIAAVVSVVLATFRANFKLAGSGDEGDPELLS